MTPQDHQQKMENLYAVGALAPLVSALYDSNEHTALNTVTNTIREALAPLLTVTLEDDGAIKPGPSTDSVGAGKSYTFAETDMDVVITLNGQRATGKTVLANKIVNLLRSEGFEVVTKDTDGSVEILRVINPAERFRDAGRAEPQPEAEQAIDCDCPRCRLESGKPITDVEKRAIDLYERMFASLAGGRVFSIRG